MAKKFGKFLLFTAAVGSAAAAAYYFFQKKAARHDVSEDEDYDDFSEDLDEEGESGKKYVELTPSADEKAAGEEKKTDSFVPLDKVAPSTEKAGNADSKADPQVEEFFDEEDGTDTEPPVKDN